MKGQIKGQINKQANKEKAEEIKRPADLSIVKRLGGFSWCKGTNNIWIIQAIC